MLYCFCVQERLQQDLNVAIELLQCNSSTYGKHKIDAVSVFVIFYIMITCKCIIILQHLVIGVEYKWTKFEFMSFKIIRGTGDSFFLLIFFCQLPADLQRRVQVRLDNEKQQRNNAANTKAPEMRVIKVPIPTFPPTAMVYSLNKCNGKIF